MFVPHTFSHETMDPATDMSGETLSDKQRPIGA